MEYGAINRLKIMNNTEEITELFQVTFGLINFPNKQKQTKTGDE